VVGNEIAVKKYVVRLSAEERAQLDELIRKGKRSAQLLTKARILLKADVSELGDGAADLAGNSDYSKHRSFLSLFDDLHQDHHHGRSRPRLSMKRRPARPGFLSTASPPGSSAAAAAVSADFRVGSSNLRSH
jgi:hypothetical protein